MNSSVLLPRVLNGGAEAITGNCIKIQCWTDFDMIVDMQGHFPCIAAFTSWAEGSKVRNCLICILSLSDGILGLLRANHVVHASSMLPRRRIVCGPSRMLRLSGGTRCNDRAALGPLTPA